MSDAFIEANTGTPAVREGYGLDEASLARWMAEKECVGSVGRVLPKEYLYFTGDGAHNYFTTEWQGGQTWDWSLESPYEG